MDLTYDRSAILNGNEIRRQAEERPPTFAEYNGAVDALPATKLDIASKDRKAGYVGMRALELMNNPEASRAAEDWNNLFEKSNQGAEFFATQQAQLDNEAEVSVMNEVARREEQKQ